MGRMLKLRDLGILKHYTKKNGGTFSFFNLGPKYSELLNKNANKDIDKNNRTSKKLIKNTVIDKSNSTRKNRDISKSVNESNNENINSDKAMNKDIVPEFEEINDIKVKEEEIINSYGDSYKELSKVVSSNIALNNINEKEEDTFNSSKDVYYYDNSVSQNEHSAFEDEKGLSSEISRGCALECKAKTLLLNNLSTKETNIKKYIKKEIVEIIEYLNSKIGTAYRSNSKSVIKLINARLIDGFNIYDFKTVIDKKVKAWIGSEFEQYLTPWTLFGDKFEKYLNEKIINNIKHKNSYEPAKLRFNNFKGRDYDYDDLEKKLLGWA